MSQLSRSPLFVREKELEIGRHLQFLLLLYGCFPRKLGDPDDYWHRSPEIPYCTGCRKSPIARSVL